MKQVKKDQNQPQLQQWRGEFVVRSNKFLVKYWRQTLGPSYFYSYVAPAPKQSPKEVELYAVKLDFVVDFNLFLNGRLLEKQKSKGAQVFPSSLKFFFWLFDSANLLDLSYLIAQKGKVSFTDHNISGHVLGVLVRPSVAICEKVVKYCFNRP